MQLLMEAFALGFFLVNQTINGQSVWEFAAGGQKEEGMKVLLIWNTLLSPEIT